VGLLGQMDPAFKETLYTYRFIAKNIFVAFLFASLALIGIVCVAMTFMGYILRQPRAESSWLLVGVYTVVLIVCLALVAGQLEPQEFESALLGYLPPFSHGDSGFKLLVLDTVTRDYLSCMENILAIDAACEKRQHRQKIVYDNFDSKPRSAKLLEILLKYDCLEEMPRCPNGGYFIVVGKRVSERKWDYHWECSVHGAYDLDKVARGKRILEVLDENASELVEE